MSPTHAARPTRSQLLITLAPSLVMMLATGTLTIPALGSAQPSGRASSDDPARVLNAANGLLGRGLFDLAVPEYERFLAVAPRDPNAPVAHYGLAVCLHRLGRIDGALEHLEPLAGVPRFQFAAEVDLLLGSCRLARGEHVEAVTALRRMLRGHVEHPSADDATAMLVEALSRAGEHEQAAREARTFAQSRPDSPLRERTDLFLAVAEMNAGRDEQAQRVLEGSLARFPAGTLSDQSTLMLAQCRHRRGLLGEAADAYRAVVERVRGPLAADALLGLGQIAMGEGHLDEAAGALDTLLREHADAACLPAATLARARVSLEQGDTAAARARLEGLVEGDAADLADDVAYWLAKCDLREGKPEEAVRRLRAAARRFRESDLSAEIAYDIAIGLVRSGDDQAASQALAEFREAYPRHSLSGDALATRAGVLHRLGEHDASRALCEQFLREAAGSDRAREIEFLAAENRYLAADYARAERAYRQFLDRHSGDPAGADLLRAAQFRLAMSLYRQAKWADAEPLLEETANETPLRLEFAGALLALGDVRFQRGAWVEAESALTRYLDQGPDAPSRDDALVKLGLSRARRGSHERALLAFEELLAKHATSVHAPQAMFESGQCLLALGRNDGAQAAFEAVLGAGLDSRFAPHSLMGLGTLARREGRNEDAARLLAEAGRLGGGDLAIEAELQRGEALLGSGEYEGAAGVFEAFVRANPDHPQAAAAQARRVISLARAGKHEEAVAAHAQIGRRAATLDTATRSAMLYEAAWSMRTLGRSEDASRLFEALMQDAPGAALRAHVLLSLGALRSEAGDAAEAAGIFEDALAAAEESDEAAVSEQASYRLGACRLELGAYEDAAAALEAFVDRFARSELRASALLLRGEALLSANRVQQAMEAFETVIDQHGDGEHAGPALLRLGEATAVLQLWARSEGAFAAWLERDPEGELWFQARFGQGWARENQGRYDEAIADYRVVVERHDGSTAARAQFQIGQCLFAMGRHEDAARELVKVDILYAYAEWSAAALYEAGRCLMAAGRTAEARAQFEAVRTRFSESSWANLATQRLVDASAERVPGR